jgi:hypothetical protein
MQHYFLLSACLLSNLTLAMNNKDCGLTIKKGSNLTIKIEKIYVTLESGNNNPDEATKQSGVETQKNALLANEIINKVKQQPQQREKNLKKSKL